MINDVWGKFYKEKLVKINNKINKLNKDNKAYWKKYTKLVKDRDRVQEIVSDYTKV